MPNRDYEARPYTLQVRTMGGDDPWSPLWEMTTAGEVERRYHNAADALAERNRLLAGYHDRPIQPCDFRVVRRSDAAVINYTRDRV